MRKRSFKRKTRNVLLLIVLLAIVLGIYYNVINSRAEKVYEVAGLAIDNYGYLDDEAFILEAKQTEEGSYQIELPESVNTKKINEIYNAFLADLGTQITEQETTGEEQIVENAAENTEKTEQPAAETTTEENTEPEQTETPEENTEPQEVETQEEITEEEQQLEKIEIVDNKITLSKEQMESKKVVLELSYDMAILTTTEQGEHHKELLDGKTEEERNKIKLTEATQILYNKVLKYEDEENSKLVELRGYLPRNAELQVEPVTQEKLTEIFGNAKIDVAYDIKIITKIPKIQINENGEEIEIYETTEINPEDLGETCQVSIKDTNISEDSQVVHVKEDNTIEQVKVNEKGEESISFEAQTFSIYAVTSDPSIVEIVSAAVAGDKVTASTLSVDDYGAYVTNYASSDSAAQKSVNWRIFHTDGTNIYLIADNYIENQYKPVGKNNKTYSSTSGTYGADLMALKGYAGSSDITASHPAKKWLSKYTYESTNSNMKATAYLLDTSVWNPVFANSNYAEYAIGGPTLELFTASYNATHTDKTIETQVSSATGYQVKWSTDESYTTWISGLSTSEDLYVISDDTNASGMWVASPSAGNAGFVYCVSYGGNVINSRCGIIYTGLRPCVVLKSNIQIEKQSDGSFKILDPNVDDTAPTITIDQLDASTITGEDYGGYVTNYASSDSAAQQSVGWRIFHTDGENIYLIADNYIENQYKPAGKGGTNYSATSGIYGADLSALNDYSGSSDIASILKTKWLSKYPYTNTNNNAKALAYLLDTNVWNPVFLNNNYAEYSTGGPTLELFTASYNVTHDTGIELRADENGYDIIWAGESSWGNYYIEGLSTTEDLYVISNRYSDTIYAMWLASYTAADPNDMMHVDCNGRVGNSLYNDFSVGLRPIIALKPDAKLVKLEDGTYLVNPTQEEIDTNKKWTKTKDLEIKILDQQSGLASGATLQYGWSRSTSTEPTNWKNATIAAYTEGTSYTTFTSQATAEEALSGEYYLWVKAITVVDTAGNAIEENTKIISTNTYLLDNAAPTIAIDGLTASDITAEDYGGYVTNYASTDSSAQQSVGWRIFHSDGENIYLIADDYIPNIYAPAGKGNTAPNIDGTHKVYFTDLVKNGGYTGTPDITSSLAKKWLSKYTFYSDYENMQSTAYLMDTNVWNGGFANNYAEYAIGGPTIELFTASYNETHEEDIEIQADVVAGYDVKWSDEEFEGNGYIFGLDTKETLYIINDNTKADAMWLSSPGIVSAWTLMIVSYDGGIGYNVYNDQMKRSSPYCRSKIRYAITKKRRWNIFSISI